MGDADDTVAPPAPSVPWGYFGAISRHRADGRGYDVVAVYSGGTDAVKVRRFRPRSIGWAPGIGLVDAASILELDVCLATGGEAFAKVLAEAMRCATAQLCTTCGTRCWAPSYARGPVRQPDGRCSRCAAT